MNKPVVRSLVLCISVGRCYATLNPPVTHMTLKFNKILATGFDPEQASPIPEQVSDVH